MSNFTYLSVQGVPILPGEETYDRVLWVSSVKGGDANDGRDRSKPLASLFGSSGAFAKVADGASGYPDGTLIIVGKGHTENVDAADVASELSTNKRVKVRGLGHGVDRPTLTWTVATSTFLMDTDSLWLDNLNLNLEPGSGTVTVAAPITISGNGCALTRIKARAGTDANNKVTKAIVVTGDDCLFDDVFIYSATAAEATTFVELTGADRFRARKLRIVGATSAVNVGSLRFLTTASTNIEIEDFFIANNKAASTTAVSGLASCTGQARNGHLHVLANTATELTGAWATKASVQFKDVVVTNDVGEVGASLLPLSA